MKIKVHHPALNFSEIKTAVLLLSASYYYYYNHLQSYYHNKTSIVSGQSEQKKISGPV